MCDSGKWENFCERSKKERSARRFLAALEMTVWGMDLFHVAYNGYVWKALFPYRHPERSRGDLLAYWYSVVCVKSGKRGNLLRKGQERVECKEKFLAALEMTAWGNGFISI